MNEVSEVSNQPNELDMLKERARFMGITFSNHIGIEALKNKIESKMNGEPETTEQQSGVNPLVPEVSAKVKMMTMREQLLAQAMKLVRVRITNMDPKKKDLPGEIITVANEYIGNVRKYIPYGEQSDDGYHVPQCIYDLLESRKFLNIRTIKDQKTGMNKVHTSWSKEFALEVLPQLTRKELDKLAAAQKAASIGD
jgi:hypothetical protein